MRLYHTTDRRNCATIASLGLRDGEEGYICLTDEVWSWSHNWMLPADRMNEIGRNEVVLAFDIPDAIAAQHVFTADPIPPDDPEYDPELDQWPELSPGEPIWKEWHLPGSVVNGYFAGVHFHHGEPPFTTGEIAEMMARTLQQSPADSPQTIPTSSPLRVNPHDG